MGVQNISAKDIEQLPFNLPPKNEQHRITAKNIKEGRLDLTNITYLGEEAHREIYSRCDVKPGDVLYIKDGATTGMAAVNRLEEEFSLLSSVGVFRFRKVW
jgi:type I restriction enzyme S subunit